LISKEQQTAFDLIAVDCDGTILDSTNNIGVGVHQAAAEARARGVDVTLVSGRNYGLMEHIVKEVGITTPIIGCGGAFIYDVKEDKVIVQQSLPLAETRELVRLCRKEEVILVLEYIRTSFQEKTYAQRYPHSNHRHVRKLIPDLMAVLDEAPVKAMVVGEVENLTKLYDEITRLGLFESFSFSSATSIDIVPAGVHKGSSLSALANCLNVPLQHVAVIGDWLNDLDMFRISGFAVAMGNAPEEVKAAANLVAPTNDEGGAAWAIREILKHGAKSPTNG
jgi:hypothetical protein